MANEILRLKRLALERNICAKYKRWWAGVTSRKGLFDMSMSVQGIEFIADSIAFGWGTLDREYITENFAEFINGKYISRQDGYTSEMYVGEQSKAITPRSTLLVLVGVTKTVINLDEYSVCTIYVCGGCDIEINNKGYLKLVRYGENTVITRSSAGAIYRTAAIDKTQWQTK